MEKQDENKITLTYNNRKIELELPSSYQEFLNLLEDKLYLTEEIMKNARIIYHDSEDDLNIIINEEDYESGLHEHNGNWEMKIDIFDSLETLKKEHKDEILNLKKNFENMLNLINENSQKKFIELEKYYENKLKNNFKKYNQMIIANIQKSISESDINKIYNQFINNENNEHMENTNN